MSRLGDHAKRGFNTRAVLTSEESEEEEKKRNFTIDILM